MGKKVFLKIVIPCFNVESTISRCIDSILSQTFDDYAVILVDDLSTDKTAEIIKKYAEKDNRIIYTSVDKKRFAGGCRNAGAEYPIRSEYVWFVDGDDYIPKADIFSEIHKSLSNNTTDILFLGYEIIENGKKSTTTIDHKELGMDMYLHNCAPWTKIIKSEKLVPFEEDLKCNEDVLQHLLQIDEITTFDCLNDTCYVYCKENTPKGNRFIHLPKFISICTDYIFQNKLKRRMSVDAMKNKIILTFGKIKKQLDKY